LTYTPKKTFTLDDFGLYRLCPGHRYI